MIRRASIIFAALLSAAAPVCDAAGPAPTVDPAVEAAERARIAVMAECARRTVAIFPPEGNNGGSGVLISADGYALSNFHVVHGAERAMKCGLADGRSYDAVVVGIDPVGDIALIKLFGRDDFPFAELGDSDAVSVGQWVFATGNPFLLAHDFQPTITYGIVSGVHRYQFPAGTLLEYADCLQTDAAINPGNSGGPLWNARGQLIGINGRGSFEKRGRVNVGVGYAVSINQIKHFLGCLKSGRIVDHATLGARVASDSDGRAIVADILEDSDAWRRGLRIGDEITSFAGRPIRSANAFKNALGIYPQGWRVPLSFRSRGVAHQTYVRLAGVHNPEELIAKTLGKPEPEKGLPPGMPRPKPDGDGPYPPDEKPSEPKFRLPFGGDLEAKTPEIPPILKEHFQERRGFANAYFNDLERARTEKILAAQFGPLPVAGRWRIEGTHLGGGNPQGASKLTILADDAVVEYRLPSGTASLALGDTLVEAAEPAGSGGLAAALAVLRRMAVVGPAKFGDVQYQGAFPLPQREQLYDVLLARYGGAVCRFFIDAARGELASLEVQLNESIDPCELYFYDYVERAGRRLPRRIEVRHGDEVYAVIAVNDWQFDAGAAP